MQVYESFKDSADRMGDTIQYCVKHDILAEYIQRKGKKVIGMMTAEWDEIEAREVARKEGEVRGEARSIINFYNAGVDLQVIVQATGKRKEEILQLLKDNNVL